MTSLAACGRSSACKTASLCPPETGTDWPERESGVLLRAGRQAELIGRQGRSSDTAGRCHSGRRGRLLGRLRHGGQTIHKGLPLLVYGGQAYCKRLRINSVGVMLISANRQYAPIIIRPETELHVCGEVVGLALLNNY